jgi:spore maturation protein CgeB
MAYPKFAHERPRLLILHSNYWLDAACAHAAEALGWDWTRVDVAIAGQLSREAIATLIETLTTFRPDFALSINASGMDERGMFAHLFHDLAIPLVTWFVDDPRTILLDRDLYGTPTSVALTWDRAYRDYLAARGYGLVEWMPLAVDDTVFYGQAAASPTHPPAFVGSSMTGHAAEEWGWIAQYPEVAAAVEAAVYSDRLTRDGFARGINFLLGEAADGFDPHQRRHAEIFCFVEGTRRLRHETVAGLADEGLVVRGDPGWAEVTPHAGPPVDYDRGLAAFYRDCAVNLNITSLQMKHAVNQRVFDCPAAGGFLLTDAQPDLSELFAEDEVATYTDLDDCRGQLQFFRDHPASRAEIVGRAQRRILGEHTYRHRLEALTQRLKDHFDA